MSINTELKIEIPKSGDHKQIMDVYYLTWLETYPNQELGITKEDVEVFFKDRYLEEREKRFEENLEKSNQDKNFFVARVGSKIVGVCRSTRHENYNQLQAIYVLPEFQGKGIGSKLWANMLEVLGTEKPIIVQLADYNKQARNFYEKLGFNDTGKRFTEERHRMPVSGVIIPEMEMIYQNK